jgi:Ca2+-binding EF-hand superfamily protein
VKLKLLCAALWSFVSVAGAQDMSERERQIFRALDLDGDAAISREEARWGRELIQSLAQEPAGAGATAGAGAMTEAFRGLDRNRDGQLSESELWSTPVPGRGGWMTLDRDGNGLIAPSEFTSLRGN